MFKRFSLTRFSSLIIFYLFSCIYLYADEPPYQAIITELKGAVTVKKSDQSSAKKAVWGMHLQTGDQIRTEDEAQVSILFASNNMITLGSNSSMTISENSLRDKKSPRVKTIDPDLTEDLGFIAYKDQDEKVDILAGLRSGTSEKIVLVSPRNTNIKNLKPSFQWQTIKQYEKFKVFLFSENGQLWSKETSDQILLYPDDEEPLKYDGSYFWFVEGENLLDSDRTEKMSFRIINEDKSKSLSARENKLKQQFNGSNYYFLIGNIYKKENLYNDALEVFHKISEIHPAAPLPHRILGKLYQRIGLKDKAIDELESAVELTQKQN